MTLAQRRVTSVTNFQQFDWFDTGERCASDAGKELVSIYMCIAASHCTGDAH